MNNNIHEKNHLIYDFYISIKFSYYLISITTTLISGQVFQQET
jgi:hypothetical protein